METIDWPRWPKEEIDPSSIIFLIRSIDTTYDHASEDLGHFCQVAHRRGDEILWRNFNPKEPEPIDELLSRASDNLNCIFHDVTLSCFLGKPQTDFRTDGQDLIYQDQYCFEKPKGIDCWGNTDFELLVSLLNNGK